MTVLTQSQMVKLAEQAWVHFQNSGNYTFNEIADEVYDLSAQAFRTGYLQGLWDFSTIKNDLGNQEREALATQQWETIVKEGVVTFDETTSQYTRLTGACYKHGYIRALNLMYFNSKIAAIV